MKLCKDCKHCVYDGKFSHCRNPEWGIVSAVTGDMEWRYQFCDSNRHPYGLCKPHARGFTPKDDAVPVAPPPKLTLWQRLWGA